MSGDYISRQAAIDALEKGFSVVKGSFSWRQDNVIAWMPLPEPYKEGDKND